MTAYTYRKITRLHHGIFPQLAFEDLTAFRVRHVLLLVNL